MVSGKLSLLTSPQRRDASTRLGNKDHDRKREVNQEHSTGGSYAGDRGTRPFDLRSGQSLLRSCRILWSQVDDARITVSTTETRHVWIKSVWGDNVEQVAEYTRPDLVIASRSCPRRASHRLLTGMRVW